MPMQINGQFDANQFNPEQGIGKHPTGKFPAVITTTSIEETANKDGGYFSVLFTTQAGQIVRNYNLWNKNEQTVEIAQKQLSALCHATAIYKLDWQNEGAALRNARCEIEVAPQTKNPQYNEVSKVYDANGNEPGKGPVAAPQPQSAGGRWSQQAAPAANPAAAWPTPQAQPNPAPAPAPAPTAAWQPGPSTAPNQAPPWATPGR